MNSWRVVVLAAVVGVSVSRVSEAFVTRLSVGIVRYTSTGARARELRSGASGLARSSSLGDEDLWVQDDAAPPQSTGGRVTRSKRRDEMFEQLNAENKGLEMDGDLVALEDDPSLPLVLTVASAADKRKAEDILALRVSHLTVTCEFFVNMVGNSRPQNQAIAASILEDMEEVHGRKGTIEGTADSGWILLDFGDIVVNVMTPKSRAYYALEKFWRQGETVDVSSVLVPNKPATAPAGVQTNPATPAFGDSSDPFWELDESSEDGDASDGIQQDKEDPFWS